jgi:hypothetical protein
VPVPVMTKVEAEVITTLVAAAVVLSVAVQE